MNQQPNDQQPNDLQSNDLQSNDHSEPRADGDFSVETTSLDDGSRCLAVRGELDLATAPTLEAQLVAAAESATTTVIVDLTECGFLDSSGLAVLVKANKSLNGIGPLTLIASSPLILKVLEITNLNRAFAIHPTLAAATRAD